MKKIELLNTMDTHTVCHGSRNATNAPIVEAVHEAGELALFLADGRAITLVSKSARGIVCSHMVFFKDAASQAVYASLPPKTDVAVSTVLLTDK